MLNDEMRFRKILVAADFSVSSAAALRQAAWLAEGTGAEVTVVHVLADVAAAVPGTSFETPWRIPPAQVRKAERQLRRQATERLGHWLAPFRKVGLEAGTEIPAGVPFVEVIRAAQRGRYDLVMAGTRGLSRFRGFLLGTTAEHLVRMCPCPVWIVRPGHEWTLPSILAAVDYSEISAKVVDVAAALAQLAACPLRVLHVFDAHPVAEEVAAFAGDFGAAGHGGDRQEVRRSATRQLSEFMAQHVPPRVTARQRLGVGTPWRAIVDAADQIDAGLVVMGSVGRTGIPGFFIGNTAEKVLRSCPRSLLTVKPDGFECPIPAEA